MTADELGQATVEDQKVQKPFQGIKHGQLVDAKDRFGVEQCEFSLQKGCLFQAYVPAVLRKRVLEKFLPVTSRQLVQRRWQGDIVGGLDFTEI